MFSNNSESTTLGERQAEFNLRRLLRDRKKEITQDIKEIDELVKTHEDVKLVLETLPSKLRHSIMVPVGNQAFFEGYLVHTNEVIMQLGENIFAERAITNCYPTLERRLKFARSTKETLCKRLNDLELRIEALRGKDLGHSNNNQRNQLIDNTTTFSQVKHTDITPGIKKTSDGFVEIIEKYDDDEEEDHEKYNLNLTTNKIDTQNEEKSYDSLNETSKIDSTQKKNPLNESAINPSSPPISKKLSKFKQAMLDQRQT